METEIGTSTLNEAIGAAVAQYLFNHRMTRADLGRALGTSSQNISGRLHGRSKWTAEEMLLISTLFGVCVDDLMPSPDGAGGWIPARFVPGKAKGPIMDDRAFASTPSGTRTLDPQIKSLLL